MSQTAILEGSVRIEAPARLHLGFIDLSGSLGRQFGSVGLTLDGMQTIVQARVSDTLSIAGPARAQQDWANLARAVPDRRLNARVLISQQAPAHSGFGSGTTLALALGAAMSQLFDLSWNAATIATLTERGARSGIGIGAFEQGGFIVDGGKGAKDRPPPVISRLPLPAAWRVLLIFDSRFRGLHGAAEIEAFKRLPPFSPTLAHELAHRLLMQGLPALAEADLPAFGQSITALQAAVGDHFAPAQGGRYASPAVAALLNWCADNQLDCYGQSSWGPTGFVILEHQQAAEELLRQLQNQAGIMAGVSAGLEFKIVRARNRGADIKKEAADGKTLPLTCADA